MIASLRDFLSRNHNNIRGWRTDRKIVVIESDDWGSACMPSSKTYQKLYRLGLVVESCPYARFDSLASEEDLTLLFSLLSDFRDKTGRHPVITANTVMTNPDFEKIRDSEFREYHYEPFTQTLKKYPLHQESFELWKQAMADGLFYPQFHGREHVNIRAWMKALQNDGSNYRSAFDDQVTWLGPKQNENDHISVRASYDTDNVSDFEDQKKALAEGLALFKKVFIYESESFIANNFIYHPELNDTLYRHGVRYIQGMKYQMLPYLGKTKREMIRHYQGEFTKPGLYHLIRNCVFEPAQYPGNHDSAGYCLKGIQNAFFWKKPAIITAHRLNFVGYIDSKQRDRNLKQFRDLIRMILETWPDAEFMTSTELGKLISSSYSRTN
jgi:hypothetical protein